MPPNQVLPKRSNFTSAFWNGYFINNLQAMFKKLDHTSMAFKFSLITIFSALFFVQLQLQFIEGAYYDYVKPDFFVSHVKHPAKKSNQFIKANDKGKAYIKLNKRYPADKVFTFLSLLPIVESVFSNIFLRFLYKEPFIVANNNTAFFLRGPPAAPLHLSLLL